MSGIVQDTPYSFVAQQQGTANAEPNTTHPWPEATEGSKWDRYEQGKLTHTGVTIESGIAVDYGGGRFYKTSEGPKNTKAFTRDGLWNVKFIPRGWDYATRQPVPMLCVCGAKQVPAPQGFLCTASLVTREPGVCANKPAGSCNACGKTLCAMHLEKLRSGTPAKPEAAKAGAAAIATPLATSPALCPIAGHGSLSSDRKCFACYAVTDGAYAFEMSRRDGERERLGWDLTTKAERRIFAEPLPRESNAFAMGIGGVFGKLPKAHTRDCLCDGCVERRERRYGVADPDGLEDAR